MKKLIALVVCVTTTFFSSISLFAGNVIIAHRPNFDGEVAATTIVPSSISLKQLSVTPNQITDEDNWFAKNELNTECITYSFFGYKSDLPENQEKKGLFPNTIFGIYHIIYAEEYKDYWAVYYAERDGYVGVKALSLYDKRLNNIATIDFSAFNYAPRIKEGDEDYVFQTISQAHLVGDILYIQHGHNTYASSSYNQNAYISAINITNGNILWTTKPLTCNSTFVILDNCILCGYGFTAEPDYLYVLDINTGARLKQYKVAKAPEILIVKDNLLYVRTYNKDYVFQILR